MARKQYPAEVYFSPYFALKRFLGLRAKHGDKNVLTKSAFKPEREMWITGVFLLGINQLTGKEYWLRPNNIDTTPDSYAISFSGITAEMQEIEIFEFEKHAQVDIVTAIKSKLKDKTYPSNYILLCYVHSRPGAEFRTKKVFEVVTALSPKVSQIWILTSIMGPKSADHAVVQVYPQYIAKEFNYSEHCKISAQKEMIHAKRDLTKKIDKVEFKPLGSFILKLPQQ